MFRTLNALTLVALLYSFTSRASAQDLSAGIVGRLSRTELVGAADGQWHPRRTLSAEAFLRRDLSPSSFLRLVGGYLRVEGDYYWEGPSGTRQSLGHGQVDLSLLFGWTLPFAAGDRLKVALTAGPDAALLLRCRHISTEPDVWAPSTPAGAAIACGARQPRYLLVAVDFANPDHLTLGLEAGAEVHARISQRTHLALGLHRRWTLEAIDHYYPDDWRMRSTWLALSLSRLL